MLLRVNFFKILLAEFRAVRITCMQTKGVGDGIKGGIAPSEKTCYNTRDVPATRVPRPLKLSEDF